MKSFNDNANTKDNNPFSNITDEQFENMILEGFEPSNLNCYAHLTGSTCYKKSFEDSIGWWITCYITENGMAVDRDYDCDGNFCNNTWWFESGKYTINEFNYSTFDWEDVEYTKFGHDFEAAWDEMVEYAKSF